MLLIFMILECCYLLSCRGQFGVLYLSKKSSPISVQYMMLDESLTEFHVKRRLLLLSWVLWSALVFTSRLTFAKLSLADSGLYVCMAVSRAGKVSSSFTLTVSGSFTYFFIPSTLSCRRSNMPY